MKGSDMRRLLGSIMLGVVAMGGLVACGESHITSQMVAPVVEAEWATGARCAPGYLTGMAEPTRPYITWEHDRATRMVDVASAADPGIITIDAQHPVGVIVFGESIPSMPDWALYPVDPQLQKKKLPRGNFIRITRLLACYTPNP